MDYLFSRYVDRADGNDGKKDSVFLWFLFGSSLQYQGGVSSPTDASLCNKYRKIQFIIQLFQA